MKLFLFQTNILPNR